ncbi:MAG: T9SS type A sorting domain-containing protein, partial [Bacteroidota bacterium]
INVTHYLGEQKFLSVSKDTYYPIYYGIILSVTGDTLKKRFTLSSYVEEFTVNRLTDGYFLTVYRRGNMIYGRSFSSSGVASTDSFLIHTQTTGSKQNGSFAVHSGKVFFSWSEVRSPGKGYDIYGNIVNLSSIVSVEENSSSFLPADYCLFQNYPNPFNPLTIINYQLPPTAVGDNFVSLKVYDVLGREVATLVNEFKKVGRYEVEFDGSRLSSGVYFYKLSIFNQAEVFRNYELVNKMILVK